MRTLNIVNDKGQLDRGAYWRVLAELYGFRSQADQDFAVLIAAHERQRLDREGSNNFQFTFATKMINKQVSQEWYKIVSVGLIAITMELRRAKGFPSTLGSTCKFLAEFLRKPENNLKATEGRRVGRSAIPSTKKTLEQAFRYYNSYQHICAAQFLCHGYRTNQNFGLLAPNQEALFFRTAIFYQQSMQESDYSKEWGWVPLDLVDSAPDWLMNLPAVIPDDWLAESLIPES